MLGTPSARAQPPGTRGARALLAPTQRGARSCWQERAGLPPPSNTPLQSPFLDTCASRTWGSYASCSWAWGGYRVAGKKLFTQTHPKYHHCMLSCLPVQHSTSQSHAQALGLLSFLPCAGPSPPTLRERLSRMPSGMASLPFYNLPFHPSKADKLLSCVLSCSREASVG